MLSIVTKTDLGNFATKADLALLRVELHKELNAQTWRFIGAMTVLTGIFTAVVKLT